MDMDFHGWEAGWNLSECLSGSVHIRVNPWSNLWFRKSLMGLPIRAPARSSCAVHRLADCRAESLPASRVHRDSRYITAALPPASFVVNCEAMIATTGLTRRLDRPRVPRRGAAGTSRAPSSPPSFELWGY